MVERSPQILLSEEKATTTLFNFSWLDYQHYL